MLNGSNFKPATYGHCITYMGTHCLDNYKNRYTQSEAVFRENLLYQTNYNSSYLFVLENNITGNAKKMIDAMKLKIWNGERAEDLITRSEAAIVLSRKSGKELKDIWNAERPNDVPSLYEIGVMGERTIGRKLTKLKRGEVIAELMS